MSKVYKCDCCEGIIKDPYEANMKEFYVGAEYDMVCGILPIKSKNITKIHLCEECYKGLKEIGARVKAGEENNGKCTQIYCKNYKDGMCKYPLFGGCIISNCRKGEEVIGSENDL